MGSVKLVPALSTIGFGYTVLKKRELGTLETNQNIGSDKKQFKNIDAQYTFLKILLISQPD